jgi:tRNA(fMet)-specific endonuclease VapC
VILDTNAVSALLAGDPGLGEVLAPTLRHHLPVIVIGEYRYGLLRSRHRQELETLLQVLVRESVVLPVDEGTAETYARIRDELRRGGRPIPENDIWIAAVARQYGEIVVSRDGHFDAVAGLRRLSW